MKAFNLFVMEGLAYSEWYFAKSSSICDLKTKRTEEKCWFQWHMRKYKFIPSMVGFWLGYRSKVINASLGLYEVKCTDYVLSRDVTNQKKNLTFKHLTFKTISFPLKR